MDGCVNTLHNEGAATLFAEMRPVVAMQRQFVPLQPRLLHHFVAYVAWNPHLCYANKKSIICPHPVSIEISIESKKKLINHRS